MKDQQHHHLIPRMCHRNQCSRNDFLGSRCKRLFRYAEIVTVRSIADSREKELQNHTIDLLLAHPEIGKFVRW